MDGLILMRVAGILNVVYFVIDQRKALNVDMDKQSDDVFFMTL